MKNKKIVYPLLVIILAMWGFIGYRIYSYLSPSNNNQKFQSSFVPPVLSANVTDTFSISANYRDPFLGKTEANALGKKPKGNLLPPKVIVPLKWPAITYGGMIKSRKSNAQLCMVGINGQSNFMKEGDAISDVQLKKIYKDSIEVVFQKEKKVVRK